MVSYNRKSCPTGMKRQKRLLAHYYLYLLVPIFTENQTKYLYSGIPVGRWAMKGFEFFILESFSNLVATNQMITRHCQKLIKNNIFNSNRNYIQIDKISCHFTCTQKNQINKNI